MDKIRIKILIAVLMVVTAYNAGIPNQTDDRPCEGARNYNICAALERGERPCAANWAPLGAILRVPNYGNCTVRDRMASKYKFRVDLAMKADEIQKALDWGKQNLPVKRIK